MNASLSLIRLPAVQRKVGLSRSVIYELIQSGQFPRPIKPVPGSKISAWVESEVDGFIASRIAACRHQPEAA